MHFSSFLLFYLLIDLVSFRIGGVQRLIASGCNISESTLGKILESAAPDLRELDVSFPSLLIAYLPILRPLLSPTTYLDLPPILPIFSLLSTFFIIYFYGRFPTLVEKRFIALVRLAHSQKRPTSQHLLSFLIVQRRQRINGQPTVPTRDEPPSSLSCPIIIRVW